ncbi:MAG: hypothetical protein BRC54_00965 [Cyanobacteria bacterium SW_7_48_12]|nr:MAG: hypothetical protein BRC54_00965 [Cyanobacteria bacterium SW_7_48_12]
MNAEEQGVGEKDAETQGDKEQNLEPPVLVSASSPLRVSPEGTLRTWAPGHLCTEHLLTPHSHCL